MPSLHPKALLLWNKANLRVLIAATELMISHKLDSNRRFFSQCDLEIWWVTLWNNRVPLLYYIKLCASFQIHRFIQTGDIVWKWSMQLKAVIFCPVWPWNLLDDLEKIGHRFYAKLSLCMISKLSANSNLSYSPETLNLGQFFVWCDLEICSMAMKILGHIYIASSFVHHFIAMFFVQCDLEIWEMT